MGEFLEFVGRCPPSLARAGSGRRHGVGVVVRKSSDGAVSRRPCATFASIRVLLVAAVREWRRRMALQIDDDALHRSVRMGTSGDKRSSASNSSSSALSPGCIPGAVEWISRGEFVGLLVVRLRFCEFFVGLTTVATTPEPIRAVLHGTEIYREIGNVNPWHTTPQVRSQEYLFTVLGLLNTLFHWLRLSEFNPGGLTCMSRGQNQKRQNKE